MPNNGSLWLYHAHKIMALYILWFVLFGTMFY